MKLRFGTLLLILGTGAGCVEMPLFPQEQKAPPPASTLQKSGPPAPDVAPEEVAESNAREKAEALQKELDRDSQTERSLPTEPASSPAKLPRAGR